MYYVSSGFLALLCFVAAVQDIRCRKIPDPLIIAGIILRLSGSLTEACFCRAAPVVFLQGLLSAICIGGFFFLVSYAFKQFAGRPAFGGGDIKLLFMVCLFFPLPKAVELLVIILLLASASGIIYRIFLHKSGMPFAPSVFAAVLWECFLVQLITLVTDRG